ncbi:PilZ domain-containing protein [Alkalimarinus sediminis]|uniref:PilZ domain-containing protein n=1 Tax=Alkalimarinus sediminis TaxID=1632866 RepID=A0A9E8HLG9_9ALTE|nr:PilZ domain-containing protein [Alkalimarinus sediminis]UZW76659.1 PilZ domain-containing protein [Alkalimarinus sediminis]
MPLAAEKRKHPRIKVSFDVEVRHPLNGVAHYQTRDMSDTGMFVISKASEIVAQEGEIVRVLIETASFVEPMTVDMRVVRHTSDGKALSFI